MTITEMRTYPREVKLVRTGGSVTIRPVEEGDADELLRFFLSVPLEERFYLREDVASPKVIAKWIQSMDHERVFPLVAIIDGHIVADGTLHRHTMGPRRWVGEVRIVVDPAYRNQGLASLIVRELTDIATRSGLDRLIFELVEGKQDAAIKKAERLGFTKVATFPEYARDPTGEPYHLAVMELPLKSVPSSQKCRKDEDTIDIAPVGQRSGFPSAVLKSMTVNDATLELECVGYESLLFVDKATGSSKFLYSRRYADTHILIDLGPDYRRWNVDLQGSWIGGGRASA